MIEVPHTRHLIKNRIKGIFLNAFGDLHFGRRIRLKYFRKYLKRLKRKRVDLNYKYILDAGCGSGNHIKEIFKKYPYAKIDAADINIKHVELNLKQLIKASASLTIKELDIVNLCEKEKYDMIINIHMLEHVKDDNKVLNNFYNALKWGGFLILEVPSLDYGEANVFLRMFSRQHGHPEHVREGYHMWEILNMTKDMGFNMVSAEYHMGTIGLFAHTIFELYRPYRQIIWLFFLPLLMFLGTLDTYVRKKKGADIFLVLKKET